MKFSQIRRLIGDTPYMGADEAEELYYFIRNHKPERCLELGHAHGASSLYIAAALDENGGGHLDTVDLNGSADRSPNIESLLEKTGLGAYVSVRREKNSYNWFLKKKIESQTSDTRCRPLYDFCFIDGAKNWTIDGLAFFLVEKLLKEDGWILFDDYKWSYGKHEGRVQSDGVTVRSLSQEEIFEPHIRNIFHLIVMQHDRFSNFEIQDDWWAWAQKTDAGNKSVKLSTKTYRQSTISTHRPKI